MSEEKPNREKLERRLRWILPQPRKVRIAYISAAVLLGVSAAYSGLKNLVLRKNLADVRAHKGYVTKPEYDSLQEKVDSLSEKLDERKAEVERVREELKQYDDN